MQKELIDQSEIKLVGLTARTNNKNEFDPKTAKIGELFGQFFGQNRASQIHHRKQPGVTFCVYTEYASDEHGDYTYLIGEEVSSFENVPTDMRMLIIPAAKYAKFITSSGQMPDVVIDAWKKIWAMSSTDFGGQRIYIADFEVYDQRAADPAFASLDIYIGIQ